MMTDENGEIVWSADYLPFGEVDVTVNAVENQIRFSGQYFDAETGLHYNYHRYYDPRTGKYLTPDLIQSIMVIKDQHWFLVPYLLTTPSKLSSYTYAINNPIIFRDLNGLFCGSPRDNTENIVPDSPLYLYVKKEKIEKKLLFFIFGLLACYTIHILFELASIPFLSGDLKIKLIEKDYNYFKWIVLATTIVKLIVAIIALSILKKMHLFQKNNRAGS